MRRMTNFGKDMAAPWPCDQAFSNGQARGPGYVIKLFQEWTYLQSMPLAMALAMYPYRLLQSQRKPALLPRSR